MSSFVRGEAPPLYLVVTDTARNPARSGIQMVVRALVEKVARLAPERTRLIAWRWQGGGKLVVLGEKDGKDLPDGGRLREASRVSLSKGAPTDWRARLIGAAGWGNLLSLARHPQHRDRLRGAWLLLPELVYRHISGADRPNQFLGWAKEQGMRVAAVLYDLIPVRHPEFSSAAHAELHAGYLGALARYADLLLPISEAVAADWRAWASEQPADVGGSSRPAVRVVPLPAELPGVPRQVMSPVQAGTSGSLPRALCVSTLEPRKNHAALLTALDLLAARHGGQLPLRLDLLGAAHSAGESVRAAVQAAMARFPGQVFWHGQVDDDQRRALYAACDFTVYPSFLEGFGLPVLESLWLGRPCVCARDGRGGRERDGRRLPAGGRA